jgi:hypothetical protein
MPDKPVEISYRSAERFFQDYLLLKGGELFVRSDNPAAKNSKLSLNIVVPEIDYAFRVDGIVIKRRGLKTARQLDKDPGVIVRIEGDLKNLFTELESKLRTNDRYQLLLALCDTIDDAGAIAGFETIDESTSAEMEILPISPDEPTLAETYAASAGAAPANRTEAAEPFTKTEAQITDDATALAAQKPAVEAKPDVPREATGEVSRQAAAVPNDTAEEAIVQPEPETQSDVDDSELTFEWLREAVSQEETAIEEPPPVTVAPTMSEKKDLTLQERERVKPVAEFIMDLTKAMLRTGYYSPEHPGAQKAKLGLFEQFQSSMGGSDEIMITNQETRNKTDILITGILDEPVNVRTLVGAGMAELFVPKLREYFNRKGLMSFAVKKRITADHFEHFIDIMSDPKADRGENTKVGELLSRALAEHGISEISAIFMDDIIVLEKNLPWRVEMAIQRLAKDLKVLPMFKEQSGEAILNLKLEIIHDIIRPLKYGQYLKDLLVNCYLIARHVENIEAEEIEDSIIDTLPQNLLLPTSQHVFVELDHLTKLKETDSRTQALYERYNSVKRIMKSLSRRMILLKVQGSQLFLEELHHSGILAFNELPPDVQYLVNTMKIVRDVQARTEVYVGWVFERRTPVDATVLLKCFRRIMPMLLEGENWGIALQLVVAVDKVKSQTELFSPQNNLPGNPFHFMFKDVPDKLSAAYLNGPAELRNQIDQIIRRLEKKGLNILNDILTATESADVRTEASATFVSLGNKARNWCLTALAATDQQVSTLKNALAMLREVGKAKEDTGAIKRYGNHFDPQVREEALHTLATLGAGDLEHFIVASLDSDDDRLRWRAMTMLSKLKALSETSTRKVVRLITSDPPEDKEASAKHARLVSQLIRTVGSLQVPAASDRIEDAVLQVGHRALDSTKGILHRLKSKDQAAEQSAVLAAAVTILGNIGSLKSREFLTKLTKSKSSHAQEAQKALDSIKQRLETGPSAGTPLGS